MRNNGGAAGQGARVGGARRRRPAGNRGRQPSRAGQAWGAWRERLAPLWLAAGRAFAWGQRVLMAGLALVVLVAFAAGTVELRSKEAELRAEVARRTTELGAAERRNEELRGRLAAADPDAYRAYVEDTARRQLNLGYPDETVVLVAWSDPPGGAPAAAPPTPTPDPRAAEPNWKRWLRFLAGD